MRLGRLGPVGQEIPVARTGDGVWDLRQVVDDLSGLAFSPSSLAQIAAAVSSGEVPAVVDPDMMRIGSPVVRPSAVICVGLNYAAHAAESGAAPPDSPVVFLKTPNTLGGPEDDVPLPVGSDRTDWEVELAVVIGTAAYRLNSVEDSLSHVAGYTVADDVSERHYQLEVSGGQWSKGKSFPGFTPLGPWVVTADEFDPRDVRLTTRVNGQKRQDSSTSDMIFNVPAIVWHLSQFLCLEPGDVILTGTPEGVALSGRFPYLTAGDLVEVGVDGLGIQRHRFI